MKYAAHVSTRETPQSEPIPGELQVENSAGGYSYAVDRWVRLDRFLILGAQGGSYYASERKLTQENAAVVEECLQVDAIRAITRIAEISESGRAPKNDAAIFALAIAAAKGTVANRSRSLAELPRVCRTATHLFQFVDAVKEIRGGISGRLIRRGIARWYETMATEKLAYQLVKYRSRESWTHRDVMRLAHPRPTEGVSWDGADAAARIALFHWAISGGKGEKYEPKKELSHWAISRRKGEKYEPKKELPELVDAYRAIATETDPKKVVDALAKTPSLPWEAIPTEVLGDADVWRALLPNLPMTALFRNLGRMTANETLKPLSAEVQSICARIQDQDALVKARIHPIQVLAALSTYASGHGARGKLTWSPVEEINRALGRAFYLAFRAVEPAGRRFCVALDVSGSMDWPSSEIAGIPGLRAKLASTALAMVTLATEPRTHTVAFTSGDDVTPISISATSLKDAIEAVSGLPVGGTDCALPMRHALKRGLEVDQFVVYTDNETWAGPVHPVQALRQYRKATGIPAKLVVVGMVANEFSIADPKDAGMLDVVGFDTATPALISDFARG